MLNNKSINKWHIIDVIAHPNNRSNLVHQYLVVNSYLITQCSKKDMDLEVKEWVGLINEELN